LLGVDTSPQCVHSALRGSQGGLSLVHEVVQIHLASVRPCLVIEAGEVGLRRDEIDEALSSTNVPNCSFIAVRCRSTAA